MQNRATYGCTALAATQKQGILRPDSDGYYDLILGGLDVTNSAGAFYPLAPAKQLFEESSSLQRRIKSGNLRGELGHPKFNPGMSQRDFLARILEIREESVCCHIREVTIVENVKDPNGRASVAIMGKVKPSGPFANVLAESLENRHENVCFSIRSLTLDEWVHGRLIKTLKQVVTWDYVNEPGIAMANKYSVPTLEHLNEVAFNPEILKAVKDYQSTLRGMGMESSIAVRAEEIEKVMGWKPGVVSNRPPSSRF